MRVLLISHEASRTGAPRVAALVARCLVGQGHTVRIVSRTRGPLLDDFAAEAPTRVELLCRVRRRLRAVSLPRWITRLVDVAVAYGTIAIHRPDLVYVNSTAAAIYVRPSRRLGRRVILHSHESGVVARRFLADEGGADAIESAELVACSPSVQRELALLAGRPIEGVAMLASVPDDARVEALSAEPSPIEAREGEVVVGCCGSAEHRKGADLWVRAAALARQLAPEADIRFVWVGDRGEQTPDDLGEVEFLGPSANPYPLMRSFDIATLPSRDDPFPLVVLEAMLIGRPVVAFAVGAVAEQVGPTGILVAPGDVEGFAAAVAALVTDTDRRHRLGQAARTRARDAYSTAAFGDQLARLVVPSSRAVAPPS